MAAISIPKLFGLTISPWSIKARWALDWQELPYEWKEYTTILTPMLIRWRLRIPAREITAPFLVDRHRILMGSHDIVVHADNCGHRPKLIQQGDRPSAEYWDGVSDRLAEAGRALMVTRMLNDEEGQLAALPECFPIPLKRHTRFMARGTALYLSRKYHFGVDAPSCSRYRTEMIACLDLIREALRASQGVGTLTPQFSYADVAIAASLQLLQPVPSRFVPIPVGTRALWTNPDLAREYSDVLTWRDGLFDRYWHKCGTTHPSKTHFPQDECI